MANPVPRRNPKRVLEKEVRQALEPENYAGRHTGNLMGDIEFLMDLAQRGYLNDPVTKLGTRKARNPDTGELLVRPMRGEERTAVGRMWRPIGEEAVPPSIKVHPDILGMPENEQDRRSNVTGWLGDYSGQTFAHEFGHAGFAATGDEEELRQILSDIDNFGLNDDNSWYLDKVLESHGLSRHQRNMILAELTEQINRGKNKSGTYGIEDMYINYLGRSSDRIVPKAQEALKEYRDEANKELYGHHKKESFVEGVINRIFGR